jgi:DNA-binding XRE family transcriptional regulator
MRLDTPIQEKNLAALAKKFRKAAGKSKARIARELGVAPPTVFSAEERPEMSLTKLRIRIIEACSPYRITGPFYIAKKK